MFMTGLNLDISPPSSLLDFCSFLALRSDTMNPLEVPLTTGRPEPWRCVVSIQVALREGLLNHIVWMSDPVVVTLYDPALVPPAWAARVAAAVGIHTHPSVGGALIDSSLAPETSPTFPRLQQAAGVVAQAQGLRLLSLGCYRGLLGESDGVSVLRLADPRCALLSVSGPNERPLDWVARLTRFAGREKRMCVPEVGTEAYAPGVVMHPVTQRYTFPEVAGVAGVCRLGRGLRRGVDVVCV